MWMQKIIFDYFRLKDVVYNIHEKKDSSRLIMKRKKLRRLLVIAFGVIKPGKIQKTNEI